MKRIHYASGTLLTGDAIADVLVRYASALAANGVAGEVRAPAVLESGETGEALLLLGPASQILVEDVPAMTADLDSDEFVAELEARIVALGPKRATFAERGADDVDGIDLDYL